MHGGIRRGRACGAARRDFSRGEAGPGAAKKHGAKALRALLRYRATRSSPSSEIAQQAGQIGQRGRQQCERQSCVHFARAPRITDQESSMPESSMPRSSPRIEAQSLRENLPGVPRSIFRGIHRSFTGRSSILAGNGGRAAKRGHDKNRRKGQAAENGAGFGHQTCAARCRSRREIGKQPFEQDRRRSPRRRCR